MRGTAREERVFVNPQLDVDGRFLAPGDWAVCRDHRGAIGLVMPGDLMHDEPGVPYPPAHESPWFYHQPNY